MTTPRLIFGLIVIAIGISIFTGFSLFKFFVALVFIYIGVNILIGKRGYWNWETAAQATGEDTLHEVAVFSPLSRVMTSRNFRGGRVVALFGGGDVDLRGAAMNEPSVPLEAVAIFGGIRLLVPKEWNVRSSGTSILGGFHNGTEGSGAHTLEIAGTAILGGVEIAN